MTTLLKQSTITTVQLGPALDSTDGVTEEVGLSPVVQVSKDGAAFADRNSATAITHDQSGWYLVELDATDTNTLGRLKVKFNDQTTHIPVWESYMVIPANVFDALILGTDKLETDLVELGGVAQSLVDLKDFADSGYDPVTNQIEGIKNVGIPKNQSLDNFKFFMRDSVDNISGKEGLSITSTRSIDAAGFASTTNTAVEVGNGLYKIDLDAADLNGDIIALKFSSSGAIDTILMIITQS